MLFFVDNINHWLYVFVLIFQMGGDFMVDERGTVVFRYPCKNPLDRPSVEHILQAVHSSTM